MSKKRILIFSLVYFPRHVGGAEVAIKEITKRISNDDIDFDMVTMDTEGPKHELIDNIHVHRVLIGNLSFINKYLYIFAAFFKALSLHKKYSYDKIWAMMANYAGFAALFFKIVHPKIPFILSLQEGDSFEHIRKRLGVFSSLYKRIFKAADQLQAISKYLADFGIKMGFRGKPAVVPNGVNNKHFSYRDEEKISEIKDIIDKKDGDVFLITTSRLVYKNGIGDIISSLTYLPKNYKFLIVGNGELESDLKKQTKELGLETRIVFAGYIDHDLLPQYLHASDIFVRPSYSEGLGNSFIEAMAAGLPVVATPVGGIPDFLIDGETGLFCEVGNPKSIADAVLRLSDQTFKESIINNALNKVLNEYDWELISKHMRALLTAPGGGVRV